MTMRTMPLIKKAFHIIAMVAILCFASCDNASDIDIEGTLIYTGWTIAIEKLVFGEPELNNVSLYEEKAYSDIRHISKVNDEVFLFDECSYREGCIIQQYDLRTKQSIPIHAGRLPTYVPYHEKIFFYDTLPEGESWLLMASMKDVDILTRIAKEPGNKKYPNGIPYSITAPAVQISRDKIIFVGQDGYLWIYNIANSESKPTGISNCVPNLWRTKTNQLLCLNMDTHVPFLLDIDSNKGIEMPRLKGVYGFVYVPSADSLIYDRERDLFPDDSSANMFYYAFTNKKEIRVRKNIHVDDGFWIETSRKEK